MHIIKHKIIFLCMYNVHDLPYMYIFLIRTNVNLCRLFPLLLAIFRKWTGKNMLDKFADFCCRCNVRTRLTANWKLILQMNIHFFILNLILKNISDKKTVKINATTYSNGFTKLLSDLFTWGVAHISSTPDSWFSSLKMKL